MSEVCSLVTTTSALDLFSGSDSASVSTSIVSSSTKACPISFNAWIPNVLGSAGIGVMLTSTMGHVSISPDSFLLISCGAVPVE